MGVGGDEVNVKLYVYDVDSDLRATYRHIRTVWGMDRTIATVWCAGVAAERQANRRGGSVQFRKVEP
jgi:hypothetical protein